MNFYEEGKLLEAQVDELKAHYGRLYDAVTKFTTNSVSASYTPSTGTIRAIEHDVKRIEDTCIIMLKQISDLKDKMEVECEKEG